jgi:hypothetical protein
VGVCSAALVVGSNLARMRRFRHSVTKIGFGAAPGA